MKIDIKTALRIRMFQEGSMSLKNIQESIVWVEETKEKAKNGDQEALVDFYKYKTEGLPIRFFDKWQFSFEKMKSLLEKNSISVMEINSPDEPPFYELRINDYNLNSENLFNRIKRELKF
jgi:hypothetical protein